MGAADEDTNDIQGQGKLMNDFDEAMFAEDFTLTGEMELDESDDPETNLEVEQLMTRVQAARFAGA